MVASADTMMVVAVIVDNAIGGSRPEPRLGCGDDIPRQSRTTTHLGEGRMVQVKAPSGRAGHADSAGGPGRPATRAAARVWEQFTEPPAQCRRQVRS